MYQQVSDEIENNLRKRLKHSLEQQGARMSRSEYESLVSRECEKFARWVVDKYEQESS